MYILSIVLLFFILFSLKKGTSSGRFVFDQDSSRQIKGFAIILIIIGHLNTEFYNWNFVHPFGTLGVALFLFASGYGLTKSYQKKGLEDFGKKRIRAVLLPYTLVTFIWLVIDYLLGIKHGILISVLALVGIDFTRSVDGTMWYIAFILAWYISFYLVFKLLNQNYVRMIALSFVSGLSLLVWIEGLVGGASYQWGVHAFIFPIGVFYAIYGERYVLRHKFKILIPTAILSASVYCIFYLMNIRGGLYYLIADSSGLVFILASVIMLKSWGLKFNFLDLIGRYSYELYLAEGYLIKKIVTSGAFAEEYSILIYITTLLVATVVINRLTSAVLWNDEKWYLFGTKP